jgi:hypothetical protein
MASQGQISVCRTRPARSIMGSFDRGGFVGLCLFPGDGDLTSSDISWSYSG